MSLFKKLIDETQMPKAQECTDNYIFTKKLFLAGLRGLQSISNPVERPCMPVKTMGLNLKLITNHAIRYAPFCHVWNL